MKKITLIAISSLFLFSCTMIRPVLVQVSSAVDFSNYQKEGMFLTESNSVSFNYDPLASVSALQLSGYKPTDKKPKKFSDDIYGTSSNGLQKLSDEFVKATRADVLEELCKKAKEQGANGIINIKINYLTVTSPEGIAQSGYEATGMAIKR